MGEGGGRRILITGISTVLASKLAERLEADERVEYLAGIDLAGPVRDLERTEFVRADLRNPLVAKVVQSTRVDTLVHVGLLPAPAEVGGRTRMKEFNVIGAMQLLAGAQKADAMRKVVVKSSTAVYGSDYADPALFTEDAQAAGGPQHGYTKDALELERYARGFARRRPDATLSVLRFANLIGPSIESPLVRYLSLPVVPTVMGYDPRLQLCHEDDAAAVLRSSVMEDHNGIFNVAGPGVLYLSQAIRLAGRPSAPTPPALTRTLANLLRSTGQVDFASDQLQMLQYGRVGDITRLLQQFDYEPAYSTRTAFEDFLASGRLEPLVNQATVTRWERAAYELFARTRAAMPAGD
jgi:UDP-glucose 4-epimerase